MRREHPDLATREPASDDEEIFRRSVAADRRVAGAEGRAPPNDGKGLAWLAARERLLVVELALLEEHGMTLPPEKQPLRGLDPERAGQLAQDRALRHAESAEAAGAAAVGKACPDPRPVAAVDGRTCAGLVLTFVNTLAAIFGRGAGSPHMSVLGAVIMGALLGFFHGFQP